MEMTCMKCNKVVEVNPKDKYPTLADLVLEGFECEDCKFDALYEKHLEEMAGV